MLAHTKCRPAERACAGLEHWFAQLGPCYAWEDRNSIMQRAHLTAHNLGFEELPRPDSMARIWKAAHARWRRTLRHVRNTPKYLVAGHLQCPSPTSVVG